MRFIMGAPRVRVGDETVQASAWIALGASRSPDRDLFRSIRERFGSPASLLKSGAGGEEHLSDALIGEARARGPWAAAELERIQAAGGVAVTFSDPRYPPLLREIADPPAWLACAGEPGDPDAPAIAVVGSRSASPEGERRARNWAAWLARRGVTIVSGFAPGIDAAAHRGALEGGGRTLAVLGCGLDVIYPRRHRALREEVLRAGGALLSEFPMGTEPARWTFPQRNRLISGISRGVLVVQAAARSGTAITARLALEQGREVWAVPGSPDDPRARGTNGLIRQGARLVEEPSEILADLLPWWPRELSRPAPREGGIQAVAGLTEEERNLLSRLGVDCVDIDTIAARVRISVGKAATLLLALEMGGQVRRHPGMRFSRG